MVQHRGSIDLEAIKGKSQMLKYKNESIEADSNQVILRNRINILEKESQRVNKKIKLTKDRARKLED